MGLLFFKKPLQIAIRAGSKRTTIRRWNIGRPQVRVGQRAYAPGVGWLMIEAVESIALDRLSDADARADGFDTATGLRAVLLELYPEWEADGKSWFRVCFSVEKLQAERKRTRVPGAANRISRRRSNN